jgi:predicted amidohydrolase
MQDLKVTLIQSELYWHNIDANLAMFEEKIWSITDQTDLIVLPEMFTTGFTMETRSFAEPPNSKTYRWMAQVSAQTKAMVIGSFIVKSGKDCYNRLHAVTPDGKYYAYDKRHLFRMAEEHHHYQAGKERIIVNWKGWKILPLVCYDLRFPVWSRNQVVNGKPEYDLLLYVANWPAARISGWDALLNARAVENLSYSIGLNRVGVDGNAIAYNGHSALFDPKGGKILFIEDEEDIKTIALSQESLVDYRNKFPAYLDADSFQIKY